MEKQFNQNEQFEKKERHKKINEILLENFTPKFTKDFNIDLDSQQSSWARTDYFSNRADDNSFENKLSPRNDISNVIYLITSDQELAEQLQNKIFQEFRENLFTQDEYNNIINEIESLTLFSMKLLLCFGFQNKKDIISTTPPFFTGIKETKKEEEIIENTGDIILSSQNIIENKPNSLDNFITLFRKSKFLKKYEFSRTDEDIALLCTILKQTLNARQLIFFYAKYLRNINTSEIKQELNFKENEIKNWGFIIKNLIFPAN